MFQTNIGVGNEYILRDSVKLWNIMASCNYTIRTRLDLSHKNNNIRRPNLEAIIRVSQFIQYMGNFIYR